MKTIRHLLLLKIFLKNVFIKRKFDSSPKVRKILFRSSRQRQKYHGIRNVKMNSAETAVFSKLNAHRAMKNRERFILPENSTIDFFIKTVDDCIIKIN